MVSRRSAAGGAADAGQRGRPGGQPLRADGLPAHVAPVVRARVEFACRGLDRGQVFPRLFQQRRGVLALIGDGGALGVVLVVAAGRPARGAGDNPGEFAFELGDVAYRLVAVVVKPLSRAFRFPYHLMRKYPGPARNYFRSSDIMKANDQLSYEALSGDGHAPASYTLPDLSAHSRLPARRG